jgi:hypothetical protein
LSVTINRAPVFEVVSFGNLRRTAPTDEVALDVLALSVRADPASLAVPLDIRGPRRFV